MNADTKKCEDLECHSSCNTTKCVDNSESTCLECASEYTLQGEAPGKCLINCENNQIYNHLNKCVDKPTGVNVIEAFTGNISSCLSDYKFIDESNNRRCIIMCDSDEKFMNTSLVPVNPTAAMKFTSVTGSCEKCNNEYPYCKSCDDLSNSTCNECIGNGTLNNTNKTCIITCTERQYFISDSNTCGECVNFDTNCKSCNSDECLTCLSDYFLNNT